MRLQLDRIKKRIHENHNIFFSYDDAVVNQIISRCTEIESGGRMIDAILTNTVLPKISTEILNSMMEAKSIKKAYLSTEGGEFTYAVE